MLEPIIQTLHKYKEKKLARELMETLYKHSFFFEEYDELAKSAFKIKEYGLAIKYGETALANALTNEKMWIARSNLINVYNHANYPEKAMRYIRANESIIPDDMDTRLEKAFSYYLIGQRDDAEYILREELKRTDLTDEIRNKIMFNLGTYELYRDNLNKGLELFLLDGQKLNIWKKPKLPGEFWKGQIIPSNTDLLVYAEAGIGDEIINVRFMRHLKNIGLNPIWYTDRKDLANLFNHNEFETITNLKDMPKDCLWTHSMTVPTYLKLELKDLWYGPYLKSLPEFDEKWNHIKNNNKLKIGIRWQGNPEYDHDLHRSVPLKQMMSVLPEDATYYSLQRDTGLEELIDFPNVIDLSNDLKTFEDTFSVINHLDIIVTSCTSVAHAAAAMGKRTFIFVPLSAYYVWSHSTKQSPWYGDNVTLLRQIRPREWDEPIAQLKERLII